MRIATYQFDAELGEVRKNLVRIERILSDLTPGKFDVIAFPEMCDTGYSMDVIREQASRWEGDHLSGIRSLAKDKQVSVLIGLSEREDDRIYNTVAVIGPDGKIAYKYRKSHLVTITPFREHLTITPGNNLGFFRSDGVPVGVMTCYELRFPEIARTLTLRGIQMLFVPAAWPLARKDHLLTLVQARAIENQIFIILASRVGTDGDTTFSGNSLIVDPWGTVIAQGSGHAESLFEATLYLEDIERSRKKIGALGERRRELYI